MTNNVTILRTEDFKFARGFKMPDDQNLEDGGNDWIKWGKDNLFPNFLNHIFYSSAYQSGLIRGKVHYLCGSGFTPKTGTQEQIDSLFGQYNAQDVLEMLFKDYELYNGFALRVLRNLQGEETFEHIDFDMLRADKNGAGWWYSDDWSKAKQSEDETGIKLLPNYDVRTPEFESVYVYVDKPKNKSIKTSSKQAYNIYPEPIYAGALKSLMTDVEIQSFHLYNIINGMKVAGVLNFANGEPPEKSKFESAIQDALTPTENSGGILINYSDGDERKPSWIPLSNEDLDKRYLTLETSVVQNIMTGHGATSPMLFGIKTASQLGGTTELNDAFEIFKRTYVRARQTTLESHLNYLLKTVAIQLNEPEPLVKVEPIQPPTPQPVEQNMNFEQEVEDKILLSLLKCGRKKSKFKILAENVVATCGEDFTFDFESTEKQMLGSFMEFAITDLESSILDLVRKGEKLDGIIKAIDEDKDKVTKAYQTLTKNGLIDKGEITNIGVRELAQNQPDVKLEVVYSYDKRPDVEGESVMPTTRDFCRALVESGLVFTREEIETISSRVDRNVWAYRGGWYADPKKERPTPFCRHIWKQILTVSNE